VRVHEGIRSVGGGVMAERFEYGQAAYVPPGSNVEGSPGSASEREWARSRVEKKSKFHADLVAYVVINAFLVGVWAVTGAAYFWPGWVLAGWGALLLLDAWNAYGRRPLTEADIDRELHRGR
jgi:2TM domain